jgi:hypothetical protein
VTKKFFLVVMLWCLLFSISLQAQANPTGKVEIFHINKGKVIKRVPLNRAIQKDVVTITENINDLYREIEPIPKKGYMVKIPLEQAVMVKNEWLEDLIGEVILIFPEYENPHLMLFNDENIPFFFTFDASVDDLLKELDLKFAGQRE